MVLQKTNTQLAIAAMQLAASKPISNTTDTDVAAETAALQSQCRLWIRHQEKLQQPLKQYATAMQGSPKEPQQMQRSSQQPQGMHNAVSECLSSLQNLCSRLCQKGPGRKPRGSATVPSHSYHSDPGNSVATPDNEASVQNARGSPHHAGADSISADVPAKTGRTEDVGHLRALTADLATPEKLNRADVLSLNENEVVEAADTHTSQDLDATSNDRYFSWLMCRTTGLCVHTPVCLQTLFCLVLQFMECCTCLRLDHQP